MSAAIALGCVLGMAPRALAAPTVPAGFVVENYAPNLWFYAPTCMAFFPDGRLLVGEKGGTVYVVVNGVKHSPPLLTASSEVLDEADCGLMSVAVDPDFANNHRIYALFTVDPDSDGVDTNTLGYGRLVRYTMSSTDSNRVDPASRAVLFGQDWTHGPVLTESHTVGALRFGEDGSLLVSIGEGSSAGGVDAGGRYPLAFGPGRTDSAQDIGAFRAQYLESLNGKILRIDPENGHGYPDNPYWDGDPLSVRSRVWQYGLRNPFRFCVRPGTGSASAPGTLYIGDVGWLTWEEIDVARDPGMNFGWPCYEGAGPNPGYQDATPAHHSCASIGTPINPAAPSFPTIVWDHSDPANSTPPGLVGNCAIDGAFYTGTRFPAHYRNRLFFADFGFGWIRMASFDANDQVTAVEDFGSDMQGPTEMTVDPATGDLCYLTNPRGEVRRIRWAGSDDPPPVAIATSVPDTGRAPLDVAFSSAGSYDPEGQPVTVSWSFGDGTGSTLPNPVHQYRGGGVYEAVLTVVDTALSIGRDTVIVTISGPGPCPSTPVLDSFNRPAGPVGALWTDNITALVVQDSALTQSGAPSPFGVWAGPVLGPNQEVHFRFRTFAPGCRRYCLLLKVQGPSISAGGIEVRYDPTVPNVQVGTYQPGIGWKTRGVLNGVVYNAGDVFAARGLADSTLEVFRNDERVGRVALGNWAFGGKGGLVGVDFAGAAGSRIDDFGGGSIWTGFDTPPTATLLSPVNGQFFATGDTVWLHSAASDSEEPDSVLRYQWRVELHHNTHVHPDFFSSDHKDDFFLMGDHDDGTGVHFEIVLTVTDGAGMADTATASVWPEIDLSPGPVAIDPEPAGTTAPARYRFQLRNLGGMPAPRSHWALVWGTTLVAEGDTTVAAHDSVRIEVIAPPLPEPGTRTLRIVADTLGGVTETNEGNNALARALAAVEGPGKDMIPPVYLMGPTTEAYGVHAWVRWETNERATGILRYGSTREALPDSVVLDFAMSQAVLLEKLVPDTRYYFRVWATDTSGNQAPAPPDSFKTQPGPVETASDLPRVLALGVPVPNPTHGSIAMDLGLPHAAQVELEIFDISGREVWRQPAAAYEAGRWRLAWAGRWKGGRPAGPGLYLARVHVDSKILLRRIVVFR